MTPLFRTPERSWQFLWNQQCHAVRKHTSLRQDTDAKSCNVKSRREGTTALSEGRLSLTKREREVKVFESQMNILRRGRYDSLEDHVTYRRFNSRHHYNVVHTIVSISITTKISSVKIARDGIFEEILLHKIGINCRAGNFSFHQQKQSLLICICGRHKKWLDEKPAWLPRRSSIK